MTNNSTKKLFKIAFSSKISTFLLILSSILFSVSSIIIPLTIGNAIDFAIQKNNVNFTAIYVKLMELAVLVFVLVVNNFIISRTSVYISNKTAQTMRENAYNKIMGYSISFFDNEKSGSVLSSLTNDIDLIQEGLYQFLTQFLSGLICVVGGFLIIFSINPLISLCLLLFSPITIIVAKNIAHNSGKYFLNQQKVVASYNAIVEECISEVYDVKVSSYQNMFINKAEVTNQELYKVGQKAQFLSSLVNPTTRFLTNLPSVFICLIGGLLAINSKMSVGMIASLITLSAQFSRPLNDMSGVFSQIAMATSSAKRYFELLAKENTQKNTQEIQKENSQTAPLLNIEKLKGEIIFQNVNFSYDKFNLEQNKIITNFSLTINSGQMVAIVGSTGSGKTTLVNLLMKFYKIDSGNILIDGNNLNDLSDSFIRDCFGMVLQETWLFEGTISENLKLAKPNATLEEIIIASKKAKAHGFIKRLPNQYETKLTQGANGLSSGEKQLLSIARLILSDKPIVILDEATSNVDSATEKRIQKGLEEARCGKTSIVIAHRLQTIRNADLVIVMEKGMILEMGNHDELINKGGKYLEMLEAL